MVQQTDRKHSVVCVLLTICFWKEKMCDEVIGYGKVRWSWKAKEIDWDKMDGGALQKRQTAITRVMMENKEK